MRHAPGLKTPPTCATIGTCVAPANQSSALP